MPKTKRIRLDLDERQQQLLKVGLSIFGETAYDSISTDQIALRAGISKGLLYHYFPSKRSYYVATLELAASQLLASITVERRQGSQEKLRRIINNLMGFALENPFLFKALVRGGVGTDEECNKLVDGLREALAERLLQLSSEPKSHAQSLRLYGWLGMAEFVCIRWLESQHITRVEAEEILFRSACWALFGNFPEDAAA